jgi:catechol 2,3-dioxygenase-like lactoylglutathione lyase family enzyme
MFYRHLLGADPIAQSEGMAIFMAGPIKILIHQSSPAGARDVPTEDHVAFGVEDVDTACQALHEQGLSVEMEPRTYYWGRSAYLRDPDGHLIELNQAGR